MSKLYISLIKNISNTRLCVGTDGQKTYTDPITGKRLGYSSGQQQKYSLIEKFMELSEQKRGPVVIKKKLKKKKEVVEFGDFGADLGCNVNYLDVLLRGHMVSSENEEKKGTIYKRTGPLSIESFCPVHPSLANITKTDFVTVDRSNNVFDVDYKIFDENNKELSVEEIKEFFEESGRSLSARHFVKSDNEILISGLYRVSMEINTFALFNVPLNGYEKAFKPEVLAELKTAGWYENIINNKKYLSAPESIKNVVLEYLPKAILEYYSTSNQARNWTPPTLLGVLVSTDAKDVSKFATAVKTDTESTYGKYRLQFNTDKVSESGKVFIDDVFVDHFDVQISGDKYTEISKAEDAIRNLLSSVDTTIVNS